MLRVLWRLNGGNWYYSNHMPNTNSRLSSHQGLSVIKSPWLTVLIITPGGAFLSISPSLLYFSPQDPDKLHMRSSSCPWGHILFVFFTPWARPKESPPECFLNEIACNLKSDIESYKLEFGSYKLCMNNELD